MMKRLAIAAAVVAAVLAGSGCNADGTQHAHAGGYGLTIHCDKGYHFDWIGTCIPDGRKR
jgi:hypothetical protein